MAKLNSSLEKLLASQHQHNNFMAQRIKYLLCKILLGRKKILLISFLALFGVSIALQPVSAFLDVPFNIASMQLDALDFVDSAILRTMVLLGLLVAESSVLLAISSSLLDWASTLPLNLSNEIVNRGWQFSLGLVNMFFILIFVAIGIAFILRSETWGMKKALPRLIIVALLVNFSLLLVKIMADLSWVFQGALRNAFFANGSLTGSAMKPLLEASPELIGFYSILIFGYVTAAVIPFVNVAKEFLMATLFLGGESVGLISNTVILTIFNLTAGFVFMIYAALFLIRIAVMWILAILSPFAFACAILPKTEGYFKQWLNALIQWSFLGIIMFFLMGLGLKLFGTIETGGIEFLGGSLGTWKFFGAYYKIILLIIYLVTALGICKKFVPAAANMFWSYGATALGKGATWTGQKLGKYGTRATALQQGKIATTGRNIENKVKTGQPLTGFEKIQRWSIKQTGGVEMAEARAKQMQANLSAQKMNELMAKAPKDSEARKSWLQAQLLQEERKPSKRRNKGKIAAIISKQIEEGKIGSLEEKLLTDAIEGGANANKILSKRPDLAPSVIINNKVGDIADTLSKISPEDLRKNMQIESLKGANAAEIITHILRDQAKIDELGRASSEVKSAIINAIKSGKVPHDPKYLAEVQKTVNNMTTDPKSPWRF